MDMTVRKPIIQNGIPERASQRARSGRFPWFWAILISIVILMAENYFPADVMETENSTDVQAVTLQGNVFREIGYPIIGLVGVAWLVRARGSRLAWHSPLVLVFGSFLAWSLMSITWSQEPEVSIKRMLAYLFMTTAAAGAAAFWSHTEILNFISLSSAAHLTVGVVGEIIIGNFTPWLSDYRFAGTLSWNQQGFCCLLLVLSSLAASDADSRYWMLFRCLAFYGLIFLYLTKSRSSMLGFVAGILVYYLLTRSLRAKAWAAAAVFISALLLYMSGATNALISSLSRNGEQVEDLTGRVPLWELALTFVKRRPMTGYGFHDFWTIANVDYFSSELKWTVSAAHSGYLETLLTLGYVGMCLHVLVLLLGLLTGARLFKKNRSPIFALATAVFAVILLVGAVEVVVLWQPGPYSFGFILLLWSLCFRQKHSRV